MRRLLLLSLFWALVCAPLAPAQAHENQLSDAEIESIREAAYVPMDRVNVYRKILDDRVDRIATLVTKRYEAGRIDDLHDAMQQITGIANELEDNLEQYGKSHGDVRKSLPKLVDATERWTSVLKQPAKNDAYEVARTLALEAVDDLRKEAIAMIPEQKAWFKEHPPVPAGGRPLESNR
jgi:hypothetical protein